VIAATLPLLHQHGSAVTSKQIAAAAGVSEGTIFKVFADKDELIRAAFDAAIDPAPFEAAVGAVDASLSFEQQLVAATELIQRRIVDVWRLVTALGPQHHPARRPVADSPALVALCERWSPRAAHRTGRGRTPAARAHPVAHAPDDDRPTPVARRRGGDVPARGGRPEAGVAMSLRRLLRTHLGPYRRALAIVVLLQALQTTATLALPALSARIIDEGIAGGDTGTIWRVGAVMLAFSAAQITFAAAAVWFGSRVAMAFSRDIRRDLFHQVTGYSAREVGRFGAPSLITRLTNDVTQVQMLTGTVLTMLVAAPLTLVIGVVLAVRQDVGLSVVLTVAVPVMVLLMGSIIVRMVPAFQQMQVRIDQVNTVLREQISGIRVVRAFVREPEEVERFSRVNGDLTAVSLRAGRLMAAMFPMVTLLVNGSSLAAVWIGGDRVASGDLEIGSLVAYLSYLTQVLMAVVMATFMVSMIPRAAVAADRIVEVLDTPSSVRPPERPVTTVSEPGTVEFREVGFRYAGAEHAVLDGVTFRVEPGTTTAIIGSTGAGKTTLVNLIARLFDATAGQVLVNGVDVRELEPSLLWGSIGYVPQKAFLFSGTVASNLRFGRPDATDEELWEALEVAQAAGFVQSMPDGLESPIAQGGTNVSGGQRQRLSIARALVAHPLIYLFDDSFSALDLATDARLRAALAPRTRDAAVVIVAQRVSTIVDADQILVLEDGRIVGRGTHAELLLGCPTYQEIVASQLGEEAVA
jgi:ATP-binding cassette subfamily B multidrug efflux pump